MLSSFLQSETVNKKKKIQHHLPQKQCSWTATLSILNFWFYFLKIFDSWRFICISPHSTNTWNLNEQPASQTPLLRETLPSSKSLTVTTAMNKFTTTTVLKTSPWSSSGRFERWNTMAPPILQVPAKQSQLRQWRTITQWQTLLGARRSFAPVSPGHWLLQGSSCGLRKGRCSWTLVVTVEVASG